MLAWADEAFSDEEAVLGRYSKTADQSLSRGTCSCQSAKNKTHRVFL